MRDPQLPISKNNGIPKASTTVTRRDDGWQHYNKLIFHMNISYTISYNTSYIRYISNYTLSIHFVSLTVQSNL